ncbi:MAG: thioredoxin-disulfide reductase [Candidatus Doudnabacteria bacterium]|nr:thioredoxin-disulfide reductase [Candidatus Doudnabacteria bacterium]
MDNKIYNVIIIGSGPAGLTAALYAARAELKPLVIAGLAPGGQLMQTTEVENFPGFVNGILGPELMDNMIKQVSRFGTEIINDNAVSIDFIKQPFTVKTDKAEFLAKTVIIATGAEANWLNLPNEQRLRGKGVSACATCDGFFFKGKEVVVIGGGDTAMEEANFLTRFASKVTIVHRRDEFRASKIMIKRAQDNPKIAFATNVTVTDVLGENSVEGITIKDNKTGEDKTISAQGYFSAIGHTPNTKLFAAAGVEIDQKGYIVIKQQTRTNIDGVFVAGDVNDPRYRQAVVAAGMGCMAALDVEKYLAEKES